MKKPRSIRFPAELDADIAAEAELDHREFSDEVRELIRLGLERARKRRATLSAATTLDEAGAGQ